MEKPFKTTLANGMRVILLENHAAPVVSWNVWANVGSAQETDQEAGLCHLIEHMIFKGTSRRPVGQIAREVEAAGGDINAYTSFDETVFYINMASRKKETGLDVLADALSDPTFDETELTREKEVVVEEISRAEDNPSQMVSQDLFSQVFTVHPYGRPIAGSRDTVRGVSRQYLLDFYRRWYVGSNLIFIGTGDFKTKEILPQIETLFSKIPRGVPPTIPLPKEPAQKNVRVITRKMPIEGHYLDLAFPIPSFTHADIPVLDMLSHILGEGTSSRLDQALREKKKLVTSIASSPYAPRDPGLFIVGAVLKQGALQETLTAIREEIDKLKIELATPMEFSRARESIRSHRIYDRQTVEAMARKLGFFEGIAENLDFEDEYDRRLLSVTPEDIQNAAKKYLSDESVTIAFCHPEKESWPKEKISWLQKPTSSSVSRSKKSVSQKEDIVAFRLSSGVRVLIRENHNLPILSIRSASLGGLRFETKKNNGINHLLSLLLTKGTHHRTAREIAEETEALSGHIDSYAGRNLIGVSGTFLSEKTSQGIELFFDILLHPSFQEEEIKKEKGHTLTAIQTEKDSLPHVAMKKFLAALYPNHPYGLSALGTAESVRSIRRADLIAFHKKVIRPDNLVLSIVGDVAPEEMKERLEEKLGAWKRERVALPKIPTPKVPSRPLEVLTRQEKLQAHIVYGFLGTTFKTKDRYSLEVLSAVLAGQGGRLFLELRDREGLAYAISCATHDGIEPGFINVYMGTDVSKLDESLQGIKRELQKVRQETVSEEELERAKRFLIGNYALDLQKNSSVASLLAFDEIYGLGKEELNLYPEKIERVTRQDVLQVAQRYLNPARSVLSIIKN